MNVTLAFNKDITQGESSDFMTYMIPITMVGITLFSIFFIIYANNSFVKARYKELGVYLTLGMDNKEVRKLVNGQNLIISSCSVIIGVLLGALFSRIFQVAIIHILDLSSVSFYLDAKAFLVTIVVFVLVFAIVFLQSNLKIRKLDILGMLKEAKQMPKKQTSKRSILFGIIGFILMLVSLWMVLFIMSNEKYNSNVKITFLYLGVLFAGIYLVISKGGEVLIQYRKKKSAYQCSLLSLAETEKKYEGNKRIMFVLSVLSSMTIVLVASPFSLLSLSESIAEMNSNNIEYVETANVHHLGKEKREEILTKEAITYDKQVDFIYLYKDSSKQASVPIVSVESYNQLTGEKVELTKGQCINIVVNWLPGAAGYEEGTDTVLYGTKETYNYQIMKASHGPYFVNLSYPCNVMLILNTEDYAKLSKQEGSTNWGKYHMIGYEDWKKTGNIVKSIQAELSDVKGYQVLSTYDTYIELKKSYSAFLFITTVLGILFFVSGGSVLYFRQFTELAQTKENFNKLYKIGITKTEMKRMITKELAVIFFVPLIFGVFGGVSIIKMLTHMFGGSDVLREFLLNTCKVVIVYTIFQGVFYYISRNQYIKSCSKQ